MHNWNMMMMERMRRVLKIQPEFDKLSGTLAFKNFLNFSLILRQNKLERLYHLHPSLIFVGEAFHSKACYQPHWKLLDGGTGLQGINALAYCQ
jgi:hypothetical protein